MLTNYVCVYRFICQGTIEERIAQLQQKKLELSASVLSGLVIIHNYQTFSI